MVQKDHIPLPGLSVAQKMGLITIEETNMECVCTVSSTLPLQTLPSSQYKTRLDLQHSSLIQTLHLCWCWTAGPHIYQTWPEARAEPPRTARDHHKSNWAHCLDQSDGDHKEGARCSQRLHWSKWTVEGPRPRMFHHLHPGRGSTRTWEISLLHQGGPKIWILACQARPGVQ